MVMAANPKGFLAVLSRMWFPLSLLALLLIAIPGFVLFGLNVFGAENEVNEWLQDRFQISYHLPLVWWLALILLIVPFALILLYFLKLKRKPLSVPSTFLWRKSIEDLHVNALFQWLRNNLLLLLQLLVLLLLIYSIMDFRVHGRSKESRHYILMIDNSASMGATDVAPSRLHWAKAEAQKEVEAANDTDYGMVIVFNSSAEILQSYTNNKGQLNSAIAQIELTQRPTRIEEALTLADSLANPNRSADDASVRPANVEPGKERTYVAAQGISTDIHLFSDGRFPDMPEFALGNLNMQFHSAGVPGPDNVNNVALVTLNALRNDRDPTKLQVFVRALNFRPKPAETKVVLEILVDGAIKGIKEAGLSMPARKVDSYTEQGKEVPTVRDTPGEAAATFDLTDLDDRSNTILHAKLPNLKDNLPLDDEAWLVVGVVRKARVLLVSSGNSILDAFFDESATRDVATITRLVPADLAKDVYKKPARNGEYDLVVFDRCAPAAEEDMPRGNTFFIGYPPPPYKIETLEKLKNPQIKGWVGKHPVLRYLTSLHDIGIIEAFKLKDLPPRTPRLIEIDQNNALLVTLSRQSFTDLVMAFPILDDKDQWNTSWPLLPSFPLFLRNILYTLGNVSDGASEEMVQPGQTKTLRPDVALPTIEVIDPAGAKKTLERGSRADFTYGDTRRVGIYRVAWSGALQRSFAVNMLDADESNIEPRSTVYIGPDAVTAGRERSQPRETWKWLVLAALTFLLLEWYVYNKRVYV
jgi:hypothetical protein